MPVGPEISVVRTNHSLAGTARHGGPRPEFKRWLKG